MSRAEPKYTSETFIRQVCRTLITDDILERVLTKVQVLLNIIMNGVRR